jgi:hypothetical protein
MRRRDDDPQEMMFRFLLLIDYTVVDYDELRIRHDERIADNA